MNLTTLFRWLSLAFLVLALASMATLLAADTWEHLQLSSTHRRAGALAFMMIGCSYVMLQLSHRRAWHTVLKETLLGIAFLFWGWEQFLSSGPWATVMDTAVVLIFVTDLSLIIVERLKKS